MSTQSAKKELTPRQIAWAIQDAFAEYYSEGHKITGIGPDKSDLDQIIFEVQMKLFPENYLEE